MIPILLIHGYSSDGKDRNAKKIYGQLPKLLRKEFGTDTIKELDLSRWVSLSDGVSLDDVSFAMDRALKADYPHLLESGFHIVIHSTGALVVRNWIKNYSPKPSPINNLIHLAGANFGSGLAHIGKGQLARWGRFIFLGTNAGVRILKELEFGNWKTLDMHHHFLQTGNDMYNDYQVQEFCLNGSQTFSGTLKKVIKLIPIRYVKEDSSDNTVRTSACNLNVNYITLQPNKKAKKLKTSSIKRLINNREKNTTISGDYYDLETHLSQQRHTVPFGLLYETAHFGEDIGIVDGKKNRRHIIPQIKQALQTPYKETAYKKVAERFADLTNKTLERATRLKKNFLGWNKQAQYEAHMQVIFRVRDQFGENVEHTDITFKSDTTNKNLHPLERMIEDKHNNSDHNGTITFYFRVSEYKNKKWNNLLNNIAPLQIEITAYEPDSDLIAYIPIKIELTSEELQSVLKAFCTTIIDINILRLPKEEVFEISKA